MQQEKDMEFEVKEFIKSRQGETDQATVDFIMRIIELEKEKKNIMQDIKAVKEDAKAEGVDVTKSMKTFRELRRRMKTDPADLVIEEGIMALIESEVEILSGIQELNKKD
jgi:uncharacterized protein (UPF0335 family)